MFYNIVMQTFNDIDGIKLGERYNEGKFILNLSPG